MAGVGVEVKLEGFPRLQRKLEQLGNIDYAPVLDGIGGTVVEQTLQHFEDERDPQGRPWRPLAASTVLRRLGGSRRAYGKRGRLTARARRSLGAMKILQDDSWQGGLISTVAHQVDGDQVVIGVNKVYAAIQQFGGAEVGKPEIPPRAYLGLSAENRAEVERVVEDWLWRQLQGSKL